MRPGWATSAEFWVLAIGTLAGLAFGFYVPPEHGVADVLLVAVWLLTAGPFLIALLEIRAKVAGTPTASRFADSKFTNRIEVQIRDAIEATGSGKRALAVLRSGLFRRLNIAQFLLVAVATAGLIGVLLTILGFSGLAANYGLQLVPPETLEAYAPGPVVGQILVFATMGMGLSTCLLPVIVVMQRQNRLISDFTESVTGVGDDGTLAGSGGKYALYLRSFTAEQHHLEQTYTITISFDGAVRQQIHPGFFIKQTIACLRPELEIVEALNLSEQTTAENLSIYGGRFRKICLFEFSDWHVRVRALCKDAKLIVMHLDDTSGGLQQELEIVDEFARKTIVFGPKSFEPLERLLERGSHWLAVIEYDVGLGGGHGFPETIDCLQASVRTEAGVKVVKYDGQWLRGFLSLGPA